MTKIEWTDRTWNPFSGCTKVSPGCDNCYALGMSRRLSGISDTGEKYQGTTKKLANGEISWTNNTFFWALSLQEPAKWKKPSRVFVCSMSDLFHEKNAFEEINAIFSVMSDIDRHTYQILTKRPKRMLEFFQWKKEQFGIPWQPKDNIWIGVSVENQQQADERIPLLIKIPAAIKFLSCEPLLGTLDIDIFFYSGYLEPPYPDVINWVIAGGESGRKARPVHPDWIRSLRDQCDGVNVPFFFKQWGEYLPNGQQAAEDFGTELNDPEEYFPDLDNYLEDIDVHEKWFNKRRLSIGGHDFYKVGKKASGNLLDGVKHEAFPQVKMEVQP